MYFLILSYVNVLYIIKIENLRLIVKRGWGVGGGGVLFERNEEDVVDDVELF